MASARPTHGAARIGISAAAEAGVLRGHPWIWRDAVVRAPAKLAAGQVVIVEGPRHGAFAQGLWDPSSAIAVRVFVTATAPLLDDGLIVDRVLEAARRRNDCIDAETTSAYRLCNGEGDRVPGLVLDRYDHVVVARIDGLAMQVRFEAISTALFRRLEPLGIRSLAMRSADDGQQKPGRTERSELPASKLQPVAGEAPPAVIRVRENGMIMVVDLARGQKTGAFLDQRENRGRVRQWASGRRVLNLFSYAGGFSLSAALGGALQVTSVDVAQAAHRTAQESFRANGLDVAQHEFVTADVFAFLSEMRGKRAWDLVISDPPSFAHNEKARPRALTAYRRLHRACADVLAPGGILCAASCSSHVDMQAFVATLDDASLGRSGLSVVCLFGPPCDHPTLAGWPEGRYLKFAVLR
jgi:23S rRNA (cytosine1962-C5)-methyltransferase